MRDEKYDVHSPCFVVYVQEDAVDSAEHDRKVSPEQSNHPPQRNKNTYCTWQHVLKYKQRDLYILEQQQQHDDSLAYTCMSKFR